MHPENPRALGLATVHPLREVNAEDFDTPLRLRGLTPQERVEAMTRRGILRQNASVTRFDDEHVAWANKAIENAFGFHGTPLGAIDNLVMNGVRYVVPMATEELSVIGAASFGAKKCLDTGGVSVEASERPMTRVQIMYADVKHARSVKRWFFEHLIEIEAIVNEECNSMGKYGASPALVGAAYIVHHPGRRPKVVLPIDVDTADAMGANVVTRIGEKIAGILGERFGIPRRRAAIVSNEGSGFDVSAKAYWSVNDKRVLPKILDVAEWSEDDPSRAVTHNKGVMNGISAVALATGQDTRAIEACAHAWAARDGSYGPLSKFVHCCNFCPYIVGTLSMRIPCGTVGGATSGPFASDNLRIADVCGARELAMLMAAVGLVQNFAAIYALAGDGIPAAHERLAHPT